VYDWPPSAAKIAEQLGLKQEADVDSMIAAKKAENERSKMEKVYSKNDPYIVWTDGSGTVADGHAGIGVLIQRWDKDIAEAAVSIGHGSNNVAEVRAIGHGLRLLAQRTGNRSCPVIVRSDSEFAIGSLTSKNMWDVKADALRGLIVAVRKEVASWERLTFEHVKGHDGVYGNERVDRLAKKGRKNGILSEAETVVAFLDTETTGLNAEVSQVLEACVVIERFAGGKREVIDRVVVRTHLEPWARVEKQAMEVNKINVHGEDWQQTAMPHADAAKIVADTLSKASVICAHNADFDVRFIKSMLRRSGIEFPPCLVAKPACTKRMADRLKNKGLLNSSSLASVCERYGVTNSHAHSAAGDVAALMAVYRPLRDDYELCE